MRKILFIAPAAMGADFAVIGAALLKRQIALSFMSYTDAIDIPAAAKQYDYLISTLHIDAGARIERLIHPSPPLIKTVQFEKYAARGLKTPLTKSFSFGMTLDGPPEDLLILKPDRIDTSEPDTVILLRRCALPGMRLDDYDADLPIVRHRFVVQDFIDTGRNATSYRVFMFGGAPILSYRIVSRQSIPDLGAGGIRAGPEIISNGPLGYSVELRADPALLAMAREMSAALDHPVLCTLDILFDGKAYWALEANISYWNIWPPAREDLLEELGREAILAQFDLLATVADRIAALVES